MGGAKRVDRGAGRAGRRAAAVVVWPRREGAYFYDWSQVMGGRCGMHKWAKADPALAFTDRVHMRAAGYDISAASLLRSLLPDFSPRY